MMQITLNLDENETRMLFKQAITELLHEKNEVLYTALAEVMEDIALLRAIEEGEETADISRDELFTILEGTS
jgi:hypothetical protein